ncbi:hypothetical protein BLNAU_2737 [Blattamonas nauphoetae]|uniref:Uncharacterized protein n=1 Tax=Blattamonas nauphoetae TaxID=2049346 RepID=A0ABQ9YEB5_9EUKA|nr:hypothetical protein BLNAU_2737 [Blattamonas nauphoetae]
MFSTSFLRFTNSSSCSWKELSRFFSTPFCWGCLSFRAWVMGSVSSAAALSSFESQSSVSACIFVSDCPWNVRGVVLFSFLLIGSFKFIFTLVSLSRSPSIRSIDLVPFSTFPLVTDLLSTFPLVTDLLSTFPVVSDPLSTFPIATDSLFAFPIPSDPLSTFPVVSDSLSTFFIISDPLSTVPIESVLLSTFLIATDSLSTFPIISSPLSTFTIVSVPHSLFPLISVSFSVFPKCSVVNPISGEFPCCHSQLSAMSLFLMKSFSYWYCLACSSSWIPFESMSPPSHSISHSSFAIPSSSVSKNMFIVGCDTVNMLVVELKELVKSMLFVMNVG